jgi:hypothetical protein
VEGSAFPFRECRGESPVREAVEHLPQVERVVPQSDYLLGQHLVRLRQLDKALGVRKDGRMEELRMKWDGRWYDLRG